MSSTPPEEQASGDEVMTEAELPSLARSAGATADDDVEVRDVRLEIAVAIATIAIGSAFVFFGSQLRQGAIPDPVTTGGLPVGTGLFIMLLGAIIAWRAIKVWRAGGKLFPGEGSNDQPGFEASWLRVIGFVVGSLLWAWLLPRISYVVTTPILLGFGLRAFGVRSWGKLIIVPIVFTVVCWFLFAEVLSIRLPFGVFEPWARELGLII